MVTQLGIPSQDFGPLSRTHKKDCRATFLFKWAQHNKVSPKMYCMLLHKLWNMPRRYVYCRQESNTKMMLCSKLLEAHVPQPNTLAPLPLIIWPTVLIWWWTCSLYPVLEKFHHWILLELSLSAYMPILFILRFWLGVQGEYCKNGLNSEFWIL